TKVTYAIGLAPGVLIALLARRDFKVVLLAAIAFGAGVIVVTLIQGLGFWAAYFLDVVRVAGSETRPSPGLPLRQVIADPAYMGASLSGLAAVILLRQSGASVPGLSLLVLLPGFVFITYQNFGNDPQWLYLLPVLIATQLPRAGTVNGWGWDLRRGLLLVAIVAGTLAAPSFLNLAYSPLRHLSAPSEDYMPLLADAERHGDIQLPIKRATVTSFAEGQMGQGGAFQAYALDDDEQAVVFSLDGRPLADCALLPGTVAYFDGIASDLEAEGFAGSAILMLDLLSGFWMYGDFPPLSGAAPWSYGQPLGGPQADYILVPRCPIHPATRAALASAFNEATTVSFENVRETPIYSLFRVARAE
ncbi:MAG: hypothetical protein AAFX00_07195, partial [Pseudomonadota bacterium]